MRALILAAGLGRRLGDLTRDRTKAMIEVGGRMLIHRALDALAVGGIKDVFVVIGHGGSALRTALSQHDGDLRIECIENPIYENTNNIYSLWLAREILAADDTLLLESDLIFDPRLIEDVLNDESKSLAVVAPFQPWMDGTVTLLDEHGDIVSLIPRATLEGREVSRYFKTVNIYKFSRGFSQDLYLPFLQAYIRAFGRSRFYEQVLSVITAMGRSELRAHRTTRAWHEIPVRPSQALVGNGASELIRSLRRVLRGPWCVPVPTFEEYLAHGDDNVLVETGADDFAFDPGQVESHSARARVLALVNPNNPTGRLLKAAEVDAFVRETGRWGMRLILDESFIDFATDVDSRSLLDALTLDQNPHVIVVRSLGKSHGVAGLRLGVLATGDSELRAAIRADLPIWNVGSLAEGFLQMAPRHHEHYLESCRRLARERTRLAQALSEISGLRVHPSHANFLLLELAASASPIVGRLLERFEILTKDLTGKAGLPRGRHIRIAVRTEDENDRIVNALRTLLSEEGPSPPPLGR